MNTNELIQRGLYYIADARALPSLKDHDWIVAVNEFGEQVIGPYDALSCTVPGLRGRVLYWRHAVAADERAARRYYEVPSITRCGWSEAAHLDD